MKKEKIALITMLVCIMLFVVMVAITYGAVLVMVRFSTLFIAGIVLAILGYVKQSAKLMKIAGIMFILTFILGGLIALMYAILFSTPCLILCFISSSKLGNNVIEKAQEVEMAL